MKQTSIFIHMIWVLLLGILATGCTPKTDNNTLKLGVIVPLSGNGAVLGQYTLNGLKLAVEEQNAKGGLLGKKIELDVQDSKGEPKEGVNIIKKMMASEQKPFMVYSIISGVTMQIKPETERNKTLLMAAVGTDKFLENGKYTIRNYVAAPRIIQFLAPYLKDSLQVKKMGVFFSNTEYARSVKDNLVAECNKQGINLPFVEEYDEKSRDFKSLVAAHVNAQTPYIFVTGVGGGLGAIIKHIRESGYKGIILGEPAIEVAPDVAQIAGNSLRQVKYVGLGFDSKNKDPMTIKFITAYKELFKEKPSLFSALTYEAFGIIFNVITDNNSITTSQIIEKLNHTQIENSLMGTSRVIDNDIVFGLQLKTYE